MITGRILAVQIAEPENVRVFDRFHAAWNADDVEVSDGTNTCAILHQIVVHSPVISLRSTCTNYLLSIPESLKEPKTFQGSHSRIRQSYVSGVSYVFFTCRNRAGNQIVFFRKQPMLRPSFVSHKHRHLLKHQLRSRLNSPNLSDENRKSSKDSVESSSVQN